MPRYVYQEIDIPYESKKRPFDGDFQNETRKLFLKHNALTEREKEKFDKEKLTYTADKIYHYARPEVFQTLCDYLVWAFIYDDYLETLGEAEAEEAIERIMKIGRGELVSNGKQLHPLEAVFIDIWASMTKLSPVEWQQRFLKSIYKWLAFAKIFATYNRAGETQSVAQFTGFRWFDIGTDFMLDLIEFASQKFLSSSVREDSVLRYLQHTLGNIIYTTNDIYSFEKELKLGLRSNSIIVYADEYDIPEQEALDKAFVFLRGQLKSCTRIECEIEFSAYNKKFHLILNRVANKFMAAFKEIVLLKKRKRVKCFSIDSEEDIINSNPLTLCEDIFAGLFKENGVYFEIDYEKTTNNQYIQVWSAAKNSFRCGFTKTEKSLIIIGRTFERNFWNITIPLLIVIDNVLSYYFESEIDRYVGELIDIVNDLYSPLNVEVILTGIKTWTEGDQIWLDEDAVATLEYFSAYNMKVLKPIHGKCYRNAMLLTAIQFSQRTTGIAKNNHICENDGEFAVSVVSVTKRSKKSVAETMAHEIGHNLGMLHNAAKCICSKTPCIMREEDNDGADRAEIIRGNRCTENSVEKVLISERKAGTAFDVEYSECGR
ncbi:metalloproteinase precursor-like protein [Dinothrombium tinctorium]|uniref:Metalloproteinase-like protein n=1 Tax=Dinothrombium tinctorium TaxID=1965070 RepID=A0A443QLN5_9ACAR|nr:metalloproteinase precursor-like protein [Dinothrombium tinctorium]